MSRIQGPDDAATAAWAGPFRASPVARLFEGRADRVIAVARAVLAMTSLIAFSLDPAQPAGYAGLTYGLLAAYMASAITLAAMEMRVRSGWRSPAFSAAAHLVDIGVFTALLSLTEGPTSPFFVLLNFSLLAALLRWGWRAALWTALTLAAMYLICGFIFWVMLPRDEFEISRFIMRLVHLVTMGGILVFFGLHQERFAEEVLRLASWPSTSPSVEPPVREALEYLATVFQAPRALLLRDDPLEPWIHVAEWRADGGTLREERLPPDLLSEVVAEDLAGSAFAVQDEITLVLREDGHLEERRSAGLAEALRRKYGLSAALCLPLHLEDLNAWLVIPVRGAPQTEDFLVGTMATARAAAAFQRAAARAALREAAVTEERLRLGRDLHDGILQVLAGTVLKLKAVLRKQAGVPESLRARIDEVCELLGVAQRELRAFIARLRPESPLRGSAPHEVELLPLLEELAGVLRLQWGLDVVLRIERSRAALPQPVAHELRHILREAAANAARHGQARRLTISTLLSEGVLRLQLADDGTGMLERGIFDLAEMRQRGIGPRSLRERVAGLGGQLTVESASMGTRLAIEIPLEAAERAASGAGCEY